MRRPVTLAASTFAESLCDKRKVPARIHSGSRQLLWLRYTGLFYECTAALAQWNGIKLHKIWKWFFQIRGSDHLCQTGRHLSDPAQRPSCYHVGWAQLFFLWYHCFSSEYAGGKLRWPLLYRYSAADLFFQTKSSGPCISGTPRGIMNSMIRSGLLCSVRTKILQRLICYWKANCFAYFICWHRHRDSAPNTRFRQNPGWPKHFSLFSLIYRNIILNLSP